MNIFQRTNLKREQDAGLNPDVPAAAPAAAPAASTPAGIKFSKPVIQDPAADAAKTRALIEKLRNRE